MSAGKLQVKDIHDTLLIDGLLIATFGLGDSKYLSGISVDFLRTTMIACGIKFPKRLIKAKLKKLQAKGLVKISADRWSVTPKGKQLWSEMRVESANQAFKNRPQNG